MNAEQRALWNRLEAHVLDDPQSPHPFSLRLAKENAWPPGFTQRVLAEYRRFAFLAVAAGHPVSPSDAIDQAWHLHLIYTRDYWGEFCPRVLGVPLHHGPARGGVAEKEKFGDWYARTLASYRKFFGAPPADLWPVPAAHPRTVRVDVARHWVIAKPVWFMSGVARMTRATRRAAAAWATWRGARAVRDEAGGPATGVRGGVGAALGLFCVIALGLLASRALAAEPAGKEWSLLDMRGPDFLNFFMIAAAVALAGAAGLRRYLSVPGGDAAGVTLESSYEVAMLAGGPDRAFTAAVARLAQLRLIAVRAGKILRFSQPAPDNLAVLERAIVGQCLTTIGTPARDVRAAAEDALASIQAGLAERGLAVHGAIRAQAHLVPLAVALAVPAIGVAKIWTGFMRSRPIGYLCVLEAIAVVLALVFFARRPHASRRGLALLQRMKTEYAGLKSEGPALLERRDADSYLPLAVGLFGTAVLANTALAGIDRRLRPTTGDGSSGTSCSTSSDSSGGGGDSGGGGGGDSGGSGCGGCGGGGGD